MSANIHNFLYGEVLPELQKNGVYSCRITQDQQRQIKRAVKAYSEEKNTKPEKVYPDIHKKFRVKNISEIRVLQFKPVMKYLDATPKRVKCPYVASCFHIHF